jgi:pimeloyl-ACP methyl ester carboxylesterase
VKILMFVLGWLYAIRMLCTAATTVRLEPLPEGIEKLTPHDLNLEYLEFDVATDLGRQPLWWVPGNSEKYVVLIHGRGGAPQQFLDMLTHLNMLGFNSVVMTYRNDAGGPASPDGLDHLGATEWRDLEAVVRQLKNMGAEEIYLFARSAGAQVAGQFLSRRPELAHLIKAMIWDNPVTDWRAVFMNQRPEWLPTWVARLILWRNMRQIGARMSQFDMVKNPPLHRPPVLVIHAKDDEVCPYEATERFVTAGVWGVVGLLPTVGGHTGGRYADEVRYLTAVTGWLENQHLLEPVATS